MPENLYGLTSAQLERIKRSLQVTERIGKGSKQGQSNYRLNPGTMYQGVLTQACYYDDSKTPGQWPGKMTVWVDVKDGNVDPADHEAQLQAVDSDEIKDMLVWPSLAWAQTTFLDVGSHVIIGWISGRWRIIQSLECPQPIPSDKTDEY